MSKLGGLLFVAGALSALFTVADWLLTGGSPSVWAYYVAMLMPVGFAVVGINFLRQIRRRAQGSTNASE